MPRVSVGVPVRDGERYLAEALESLLAQTFDDFEIVIADNASTDRTADICRSYQARDRRIRYVRNERNLGAAPNFNRVFELSSAPLFHGSACDDLYEPRFLEACVAALDTDPGVVLSYTGTKLIDDQGEPLLRDPERNCYIDADGGVVMRPHPSHIGRAASPEMRFREVLWQMGWCLPLSGVIRRQALLRTALYRDYYGADKVLLAELALQGRFHQVGEDLFAKRIHRGCTHYKTIREKAEHENQNSRRFPQFWMLCDYAKMAVGADMGARQRLHCMMTILGMTRRADVWRRLLMPGPNNYFGLSFSRK